MQFSDFKYLTNNPDRSVSGEHSRLSRLFRAGEIIRLQPSVYLDTDQWLTLNVRDRVRATIGALALTSRPNVMVGQSTFNLYSIPVIKPGITELPQIFVGSSSLGNSRTRQAISCYGNEANAHQRIAAQKVNSNYRAGLPQLPVIRAQLRQKQAQKTELSFDSWPHLIQTETQSEALLRCLHDLPFETRVTVIEHLLRSGNTLLSEVYATCGEPFDRRRDGTVRWHKELLFMIAQKHTIPYRRRVFEEAINFASFASESVGESLSHGLIHKLGFAAPQLQVQLRLSNGRLARPDYMWPDVGVVGEFDGAHKYTRSKEVSGKQADQVVFEEKKREDGIRALGNRVCRWTWADLMHPQRLASILSNAGVPRRKGQ